MAFPWQADVGPADSVVFGSSFPHQLKFKKAVNVRAPSTKFSGYVHELTQKMIQFSKIWLAYSFGLLTLSLLAATFLSADNLSKHFVTIMMMMVAQW